MIPMFLAVSIAASTLGEFPLVEDAHKISPVCLMPAAGGKNDLITEIVGDRSNGAGVET